MKDAQKPDHISLNNMIARLGIRGTPGGGCAPRAPLGGRGFWFGQRPSSAEGPAWPAPSRNSSWWEPGRQHHSVMAICTTTAKPVGLVAL